MPIIPPELSPLISNVRAAGLRIPPDAIVLRGYPGPPHGVLEQASAILVSLGENQISPQVITDFNQLAGPPAPIPAPPPNGPFVALPWRIYLTARLDCWVEIENWYESVVHLQEEDNTDRLEAYTIWLRRNERDDDCCRIHYRVVSEAKLEEGDTFLAGRLVEDYMARSGSASVGVWDEQGYGLPTAKSLKHCF